MNFAIEKSTAPQPTTLGSQSDGTAEAVVTVNGVSSRSEYVHLRAEPSERKRWQEAARASGRPLSTMIRAALEVELERCDHEQAEQVAAPSLPPQTQPARTSIEEKLAGSTSSSTGSAPVEARGRKLPASLHPGGVPPVL